MRFTTSPYLHQSRDELSMRSTIRRYAGQSSLPMILRSWICGLRKAETEPRTRQIPLLHQGIEHAQKVQVNAFHGARGASTGLSENRMEKSTALMSLIRLPTEIRSTPVCA